MIDSTATSSLQLKILEANQNILERKLDTETANFKTWYESTNDVNQHISSQIEMANFNLGIITFFFTVLGLGLAWYINNSYNKISKIKEEINQAKDYIDGHNDQFYARLERSETRSFLKRLAEVPEDINNVAQLLLSRSLETEDYFLLKQAYLAEDLEEEYENSYLQLFSQHFFCEAINDEVLQGPMLQRLDQDIRFMFKRDIQNLFTGVARCLNEGLLTEEIKTILFNKLFKGLYRTKHRNLVSE